MHIDSPQFVRRKVLNQASPSKSHFSSHEYQYGQERAQLSEFVSANLKSTDKNGQILERFRLEAAEYKKKLKSKVRFHEQLNSSSVLQSIVPLEVIKEIVNGKQSVGKSVPTMRSQVQSLKMKKPIQEDAFMVETAKYNKILRKSKKRETEKRDGIIANARRQIESLKLRMDCLEAQRNTEKQKSNDEELQRLDELFVDLNKQIKDKRRHIVSNITSVRESLHQMSPQQEPTSQDKTKVKEQLALLHSNKRKAHLDKVLDSFKTEEKKDRLPKPFVEYFKSATVDIEQAEQRYNIY